MHVDFKDVRGQEHGKRGLEVAAAGGHSVCLVGPTGSGKTMLAHATSGILPDLLPSEQMALTEAYRKAGMINHDATVHHRPFYAPVPSEHIRSLIGTAKQTGAMERAGNGILLFDNAMDFGIKLSQLFQANQLRQMAASIAKSTADQNAPIIIMTYTLSG